jgi:O-antigen/teichoic acid export membrane protein
MRSRKLIKGSVLNTANLIVQIFAGLYLMPLMIHTFGDAGYGIWILVASFMGYASILDLGLPSAVGRFVSQAIGVGGKEGRDEIKYITSTAFYIFVFIALLTLPLIFLFMKFAYLFVKEPAQIALFRTLLAILCINNLFLFPTFVFEGTLTANLRFDLITSSKILFTLLRVFFTVILIRLHYDLVAIAWATVGSNILEVFMRVLLAYHVDKHISIAPVNFKMSIVRKLFGYSIFTFIAKIADILRFQVDSLVISAFTNVSLITPFRIASRLIEYFMQFISGLTGVFNPYFSQEEGKKNFKAIQEKFLFVTKINVFIATFTGLLLILFGKNFIYRWVGSNYSVSYAILVILAVPVTFALIQSAVFPLLYGISKHKFIAYVNILEGVFNLVLSILLVKRFGIIGVAIGTAIPMVITKIFIQPVYVTRILKIPLSAYANVVLRPFILTLFVFLVPWSVILHFLRPDYKNLMFFGSIQLVIFLVALIFYGFSNTEKDYLKGLFKIKTVNCF